MDIKYSKEIFKRAVSTFKPKAIVLMFSGGDDSLTTYEVSKELGIKFDFVIHGRTGAGIKETTEFVNRTTELNHDKLLIADAGNAYEDYVLRKGFFGKGISAHSIAYHILKATYFRKVVSKNLRKGRRKYPILFINGARRKESDNRMKTMVNPFRIDPATKNNIWINLINESEKYQCIDYLEGNSVKRNPVSINLCRSGDCLCGTTQSEGDRQEASFFYPDFGKWLDNLEKEVLKKHPWRWGESINIRHLQEQKGQLSLFDNFEPMCTGCKIAFEKNKN